MLTRLILAIATLGSCATPTSSAKPVSNADPPPLIFPNACGGSCSLSLQCHDILARCKYCSFGQCSETLPASEDAGVNRTDLTSEGNSP